MTDDTLGRISGDLDVMRRALALQLGFGRGILAFGFGLAMTAFGAATASLLIESDWFQFSLLMAILGLILVGLYLYLRRATNVSPEIVRQVLMSICIYAVVWVAVFGYSVATLAGPSIGVVRTALVHATCIVLLVSFTLIVVWAAVKTREQYYCLGLGVSTLLAGMLSPIVDPRFAGPLAHCLMAIGLLVAVAIQRVQLQEAVSHHAAD